MHPHEATPHRPGKAAARTARRLAFGLLAAAAIGFAGDAASAGDEAADAKANDAYVARFERAQRLLGRGSDAEAEKLLRQLIVERPDEAPVHHALAVVFQFRRRGEEAAAEFLTAARLAPDDPVIRRDCGLQLVALGRLADAESHLAKAHTLWPKDLDTLIGHAGVLRALGRADAAEKVYREAVAADANSVDAAVGLAACIVAKRPEEALSLVRAAPGRWVDVLLVRGLAQEGLARYDDARRELVDAAKAAPPGPAGAQFLGDIAESLLRCGWVAEAEEVAARWCVVDLVETRPSSRASLCLAVARAAAGRADDALKALDAAASSAKEPAAIRVRAVFLRAAVLLGAARREEATKALEDLAASSDATFERTSALRVLGRVGEDELAAAASKGTDPAALANDREWVEALAAAYRGDAAEAARRREAAAKASRPPGEYPGALVRPAPAGSGSVGAGK